MEPPGKCLRFYEYHTVGYTTNKQRTLVPGARHERIATSASPSRSRHKSLCAMRCAYKVQTFLETACVGPIELASGTGLPQRFDYSVVTPQHEEALRWPLAKQALEATFHLKFRSYRGIYVSTYVHRYVRMYVPRYTPGNPERIRTQWNKQKCAIWLWLASSTAILIMKNSTAKWPMASITHPWAFE
jgi:hypothetical protein